MPNPIDDKPEVFIEFPSRAVGTADLQTDTAKLFLMGYLQHPRQQPGRDSLPAEPGSNGDVVNLNLVRNKPEYNITCNQLNVPSGKPSNQYVGKGVGRLTAKQIRRPRGSIGIFFNLYDLGKIPFFQFRDGQFVSIHKFTAITNIER